VKPEPAKVETLAHVSLRPSTHPGIDFSVGRFPNLKRIEERCPRCFGTAGSKAGFAETSARKVRGPERPVARPVAEWESSVETRPIRLEDFFSYIRTRAASRSWDLGGATPEET